MDCLADRELFGSEPPHNTIHNRTLEWLQAKESNRVDSNLQYPPAWCPQPWSTIAEAEVRNRLSRTTPPFHHSHDITTSSSLRTRQARKLNEKGKCSHQPKIVQYLINVSKYKRNWSQRHSPATLWPQLCASAVRGSPVAKIRIIRKASVEAF